MTKPLEELIEEWAKEYAARETVRVPGENEFIFETVKKTYAKFFVQGAQALLKHLGTISKSNPTQTTVSEIALFKQLCEANARVALLSEALSTLRNEVKGTLSAHEMAIRYDHGNSNWECLEIALKQADEALKRGERV
jgi:hypothetical protein